MPYLRQYNIFISHAWKYGNEYNRLINLLDSATNFNYYNYSAPKEKPLHNLDATDVTSAYQIKTAIERKIQPCSCVLIISGMYTNYRHWMQREISIAKQMGKPIIAIKPYGAQVIPVEVSRVADKVVNWDTNSIIAAIREYSL